jgi:drug/metabolite transporter (DMT)-like permease
VALAGVALAVGGIGPDPPPLGGLLLVVVSPLIYSVWIILSARLSGERRRSEAAPRLSSGDAAATAAIATALMMTATATVYWLLAFGTGQPVLPAEVPVAVWPNLLGIGVFATFIAIQAFYAGAQRVGAAQAALISTVEPIWTISLAALLLGESLQPIQLVGGGLIIAAVILAQTGPAAADEARPAVRLADE